jgi:hypothetical protein
MIVKANETRPLELRNKNVIGLSLKAVSKLVSGQTESVKFNLSKTIIKIILFREGRERVLMNDTLLPLVIESAYRNGTFAFTQGQGVSDYINLDGAAQNPYKMLPLLIDFGSVINIKGDDQLICELIVNAETFIHPTSQNTVNVDLGASYIQMDEIEGIGLEYRTPRIITKAISSGESRVTLSLGDNIERLSFINTLTSGTYAIQDSPLNAVSLSSDKLQYSDNLVEMIAKRAQRFQSPALSAERNHSFILHEGTELDSVNLDLTFTPAKVLAGENYIVYRAFDTSVALISRAQSRAEKHESYDLSKIPAK